MGSQGEGIAIINDEPVYVPFTLEGETISAVITKNRGVLSEIIEKSPERIGPICEYFGKCGGCVLQHWQEDKILEWKSSKIQESFQRACAIEAEITIEAAWGLGRRRTKFNAKRINGQLVMGYMGAKSNELVGIDSCPILTATLSNAIIRIKELARSLIKANEEITINVTDTDAGIDVEILGLKPIAKFTRPELENLAKICKNADITRLTLNTENAYVRETPFVKMGKVNVELPPNSFLQATAYCENEMANIVTFWAKGHKRIADLFSGVGTFALRLKEFAEVTAYEIDAPSIAALNKAAKAAAGGHMLKGVTRDLFRMPVSPLELKNITLVVLDPPRAGAEAQIKQLIRAKTKEIIYVSCDYVSFARDAKQLLDAGYKFKAIKAFDQFRFSDHVELVAKFAL